MHRLVSLIASVFVILFVIACAPLSSLLATPTATPDPERVYLDQVAALLHDRDQAYSEGIDLIIAAVTPSTNKSENNAKRSIALEKIRDTVTRVRALTPPTRLRNANLALLSMAQHDETYVTLELANLTETNITLYLTRSQRAIDEYSLASASLSQAQDQLRTLNIFISPSGTVTIIKTPTPKP